MEIRELKCFLQIAKDKSYTSAAKKLFISQPALSKTIKKLESELGVKLFEKNRNKIELTDCGSILLECVPPIVYEFDRIKDSVQEVVSLKKGEVSICTSPIFGSLFLCPVIADFYNKYQGIELKIFEAGSRVIEKLVASNELDIGICMIENNDDQIFEKHVLYRSEMVVGLHKTHSLSGQKSIRFKQLSKERFNLYNKGFTLYDSIIQRCEEAGFYPKMNLNSSKVDFLLKMTSCGNGICLLPKPYAEQLRFEDIYLIPFEPVFPWEICVVMKRNRYKSYATKAFFQHLMSEFNIELESNSDRL